MIEAKYTGIGDYRQALTTIVPRMRKRVVLNALRAGARILRDQARQDVPVLKPGTRAPYRTPGTVRGAIAVRTSRIAGSSGDVGVFVNVRPAKGAKYRTIVTRALGQKAKVRQKVRASQRGAKSPTDPFYWRFIEFGTKKMSAKPFLRKAAQRLGDALAAFEKSLGPALQKLNSNPQDPL